MVNQGTIKLGAWGGEGGVAWDFFPGTDSSITEIVIGHGDILDSLSFKSFNRATGQYVISGKHGGSGGDSDQISIGEEEYLTSISGTTLNYYGRVLVGSLTFHTNKTQHGPYGHKKGSAFEIPIKNGKVVGFFGRAGDYIDALGIQRDTFCSLSKVLQLSIEKLAVFYK